MEKAVTTDGVFTVGELCFAYYWKNLSESHEVELFYCRIEAIQNDEYCTGILFNGGEWTGNNHSKGRFTDICIADLRKID